MNTNNTIHFVHLLNDYSGSPKVLSQVILSNVKLGRRCKVYTSNTEGFLSNLDVPIINFPYGFYENKIIRLFMFFYNQVVMFVKVWMNAKKNDIIYINTLLPFGAAIAGKLKGVSVIYHIHETSVNPQILKSFLRYIVERTANDAIFVSKYLLKTEKFERVQNHFVYNAIPNQFVQTAMIEKVKSRAFNVLMLCSLKIYKGIFDFIQIAKMNPSIKFTLVINCSPSDLKKFVNETNIPSNVSAHPRTSNVHKYYKSADCLLNLSHPDRWVETFGLTIIEAMAYGIPSIVPPVGGPAELVENYQEGFKILHDNYTEISAKIIELMTDNILYQEMSENCIEKVNHFSEEVFEAEINDIIGVEPEDQIQMVFPQNGKRLGA